MSQETPDSEAAPDRVFARAATALVAGAAAIAILGAVATERLGDPAARFGELATLAANETALLREIAADLGRAARLDGGSERAAILLALDVDARRLQAIEAHRASIAVPGVVADVAVGAAMSDLAAKLADGLEADDATALAAHFGDRLAPGVERDALRLEMQAVRAQARARVARVGLFALHLAGLALLAFVTIRPARRRIAAWVHEAREAAQDARHRLLHDPLTQMPNATFLQAHLERLAAGADRPGGHVAVMRVDLDRFHALRETLGPRAAEDIIRIVARRLRRALRAGDFAAYLGADDFVVVASDLEEPGAAAGIAHRLQATLTKPFSLQGGARRVGCSIGVAMLADDEPEAGRALANAEIALTEARETAPGAIRYFRESLRVEAERRETLYAELAAGLERGEFGPFFQPQIDLVTGALAGFEALARWRHPRQGLLTPIAFLDLAEAADLGERLGEIVLGQTLAAITAWDAAGVRVPKVGVNFAMAQLRDPRLIEKIKWEVERHDVEPSRIAIEVLETVLIKSDEDLMVRNLRGLASAGFQIELDDFGTGHASIQNLRRLMVHTIKIDRSFVHGIETSAESRTLTASMIAMARALGIRTLAEGVETPEAAATLAALGCEHVQGYVVATPMSLTQTFGWLEDFAARGGLTAAPVRPASGDPNKP